MSSPRRSRARATCPRASRSWQSRAKATRTTSPFQQGMLNPSEHQRWLEAGDSHHPPHALAVVGRLPAGLPLAIDEAVGPPVAVGSTRLRHGEDLVQHLGVLGPPIEAALARPEPKVTRGPCHVQRPADCRHGSIRHRPDPLKQAWAFSYGLPGGLEDLDRHRLLADQSLQLLDPLARARGPGWPGLRPRPPPPPSSRPAPPDASSFEGRSAKCRTLARARQGSSHPM